MAPITIDRLPEVTFQVVPGNHQVLEGVGIIDVPTQVREQDRRRKAYRASNRNGGRFMRGQNSESEKENRLRVPGFAFRVSRFGLLGRKRISF